MSFAPPLSGVITNGTAVLGLGNIGPLAGKPVMEGKVRCCGFHDDEPSLHESTSHNNRDGACDCTKEMSPGIASVK